jgi:hypothetical protein
MFQSLHGNYFKSTCILACWCCADEAQGLVVGDELLNGSAITAAHSLFINLTSHSAINVMWAYTSNILTSAVLLETPLATKSGASQDPDIIQVFLPSVQNPEAMSWVLEGMLK